MDRRVWIVAAAAPLLALVGWTALAGSEPATVHAALDPNSVDASAPAAGAVLDAGAPTAGAMLDETVRASRPDSAQRADPQTEDRGTLIDPSAEVPAPPPRARLDVLVRDGQSGRPLAGARVAAYSVDEARAGWTSATDASTGSLGTSPLTDERGVASFELPAGVDLRLSVRGAESAQRASVPVRRLAPHELRELVVQLERAERVTWHGVLRDKQTGSPVPNAELRFVPSPNDDTTRTPWTTSGPVDAQSGASGAFMLMRPTWTRAQVQVDAPGYGPTTLLLDVDHSDVSAPRVVWLEAAAAAEVRALDALARPCAGIVVEVTTAAHQLAQAERDALPAPDVTWKVATDADGVARFPRLPARVPLAVELASGAALIERPAPLQLEPGESGEREVVLAGGTRVYGRLARSGGRGVADVELWLVPAGERRARHLTEELAGDVAARIRTDADGRYELPTVPAGLWWIGPSPATVVAPLARCVDISAELGALELDLRAQGALGIRGVVHDRQGNPSARARVFVRALTSGEAFELGTDEAGRFALEPVAPGPYEVGALPGPGHAGASARVIEAGNEPLALVLRAGACLDGVAIGPDGRALDSLAQVLVTDARGRVRARLGDGARLAIDALEPGTYSVAARDSAGNIGWITDVDAADGRAPTAFALRLERGLALELVGPDAGADAAWRVYRDGACVSAGTIAAGASARTVVPPGSFVVQWRRAGELREEALSSEAEGPARARFSSARTP